MAKGGWGLLRRHQRRRLLRRNAPRRQAGSVASRARDKAEAGGGGGGDAWKDFAASFAAAGLVLPEGPKEEKEEEEEEGPGGEALAAAAEAHEGRAALLLPPGRGLTFSGKCWLSCLVGRVRVLGFCVGPDQPPCRLFSPTSHCPLTVRANALQDEEEEEEGQPAPLLPAPGASAGKERRRRARSLLRAHGVPPEARRKLMKKFTPQCSIVLLERLDTPVTRFILSHPTFSHIFRAKRQKVPCFTPEDAVLASTGIGKLEPESGLLMSESTLSAVEELIQACQEEEDGCPIILVCGPKSVGKSTFNRYLINLLLNRIPCIEFLECDLGQPEFTPPGCVSLVNVTEPLLGPPFTHQRRPRKMVYFGETSCEQDTERYIDTLKYVFSAYERDVPLVVNTMGWVKGAGLLLLVDLIQLLSPSHIVQISTQDFKDMPRLSAEYIHEATGLHTRGQATLKSKGLRKRIEDTEQPRSDRDFHLPRPGHRLLCVRPQFQGAGAAGNVRTHSSTLRDMAVLGYLGQLQPPEAESVLPLHSLVPYQVPFNAVALRVIHADVAPAHILCAINASWVALCQTLEEIPSQTDGPVVLTQTPICDCLGFGIVRGVDVEKKLYYLLTPVAPENLRLVNCLLIGNISIPHCVFLNQIGIEGEIPYVTSEYNYDISGAGKLKVKKHLKRRGHSQP